MSMVEDGNERSWGQWRKLGGAECVIEAEVCSSSLRETKSIIQELKRFLSFCLPLN